jgi:hypothetical protein
VFAVIPGGNGDSQNPEYIITHHPIYLELPICTISQPTGLLSIAYDQPLAILFSHNQREMTSPRSLYLFTTSQNPLPGRYPRPAKPVLNVPPLIHRSLHQALDQSPPSLSISQNQTITIPHIEHVRKYDIPSASEHDELEITLKIHLIGPAKSEERATWVKEALGLVQSAIGIGGADTLLIGFKGVDYKGKKTVDANGSDSGDNIPASDYSVSSDMEDHIIEFWTHLVDWLSKEDGVTIKTLGTMYLPLGVLKRLKGLKTDQEELGRIKVNSLDTPDCHHLPKEYTSWAKENGVQLWAGGGGEGSGM